MQVNILLVFHCSSRCRRLFPAKTRGECRCGGLSTEWEKNETSQSLEKKMGSRMGIESSPGRTELIRSVSYWEDEDEKVFVLETERSGRQLPSHGGYLDCTLGGGEGWGGAVWMAGCLTVLLAAVVLAAHVFALFLAGADNYIAALPLSAARQPTPGVTGQTGRFMFC